MYHNCRFFRSQCGPVPCKLGSDSPFLCSICRLCLCINSECYDLLTSCCYNLFACMHMISLTDFSISINTRGWCRFLSLESFCSLFLCLSAADCHFKPFAISVNSCNLCAGQCHQADHSTPHAGDGGRARPHAIAVMLQPAQQA